MGRWVVSWGKYPVLVVCTGFLIWGTLFLDDIQIGNPYPGSAILWPWHRYNVDSMRITFSMPMLNPLYVIAEIQDDDPGIQGDELEMVGAHPLMMREVRDGFARYMKQTPENLIMFVQTVLDQIPGRNQGLRSNDPNWYFLPTHDLQRTGTGSKPH